MVERGDLGDGGLRPYPQREPSLEQPIELRRHLDALGRGRIFIFLFVVLVTAVAVAASVVTPEKYRARATIVLEETLGAFGTSDVAAVERRLQTIERLLGTNEVLEGAARSLDGETRGTLAGKVTSSVDDDANIITITAFDGDPEQAAAIANAVAGTFLDEQRDAERERLADARATLENEVDRLRVEGGRPEEIEAIRQRISELSVREVSAGSELQLAQAAEPPSAPYSPRPVRNGVVAFFAALFLAVLIVLGRDQLRPRVSGPRQLSRLMNLPMLVGIPYVRTRLGRKPRLLSAMAEEAYQTLQASIRFDLPATSGQRVILLTSALESEGKTTAAVGLGRALARVGHKTLLVCADFRFPRLHEVFEIDRAPGMTDLLTTASVDGGGKIAPLLNRLRHVSGATGRLHVIPSGSRTRDPAALLFSGALDTFFEVVSKLDYNYVILDGPPLLGIADSHALAQRADGTLLVSRLDRVKVDDLIEVRDLLERLDVRPLGVVVVGARRAASYAYAGSGGGPYEESGTRRMLA